MRMHSAHERLDETRFLAARVPFIVVRQQERRREPRAQKVSFLPNIQRWIAFQQVGNLIEVALEEVPKLAIGS